LEDVLGDKFQPLKFNGSWLKNNQLLITDGNDNLQILDAPSGTLQPLLYNESIVSQTKLLLIFRINGSNFFLFYCSISPSTAGATRINIFFIARQSISPSHH
jgi:hypothetical protein